MDYFRPIVLFLLNVYIICTLGGCCNYRDYELEAALQELKNHIFSTKEDEPKKQNIFVRKDWEHDDLSVDNFENLVQLGSGRNGVVYSLGDNYVLKVLKKNKSFFSSQENIKFESPGTNGQAGNNNSMQGPSNSFPLDEEEETSIPDYQQITEVSLIHYLCSNSLDCLCKYYAIYEDDLHYYIILERLQGEVLDKYITTTKLDNKTILSIYRCILSCVQDFHNNGFVHLDLKGDNVMVLSNGNIVKLIDPGSGCYISEQQKNIFKIVLPRGAVRNFSKDYAEIILENNDKLAKGIAKNDLEVCKNYDIWCCGCILYEMIFKKILFPISSGRNIWNYISSFFLKFRYIKNVYKDRLNFDLDDYTEIRKLRNKKDTAIFYTLLSSILTKDDADRKSINVLLQMIDDELENTNKV
jgi:serine/threonine protein kinase